MRTEEAIALIRPAGMKLRSSGNWADLGCGPGLFTKALAHYQPDETDLPPAVQPVNNILM